MKNKMRFGLLVAGVASLCNVAFAQSVDQGKKFLYYQRYKSAKDVFDKILASNPNNIDAVYWEGQTLLAMKDSVAAKELYSKALQSNGNAPLLLVGMGNVELREGKTQDARQRFETAISLTKGKDINVLNAIGDANDDAHAGDATYAIEKLTQATQVKNFNNAETYLLMGDAYRKLIDGGNAVTAYNKALSIDPKMAEAKYKIGKIYETQNNREYFLPAFEEAVQMDPNYAPALYELYFYWYTHDINKAKDYFDKYLAVSDPNPSNDYDKASILWASKDYDGAINTSKAFIQKLGAQADPRYYKLIAYSYDSKGDSVNALDYMKQYFAKQKPDGFVPKDYSGLAMFESKFPTDSADVVKNYQLAIDKDTAMADKQDIIKEAIGVARAHNNKPAIAYWLGVSWSLEKNPTNTDTYNWGFAHYSAGQYKTADSIFCGIYESKFPTEFFGYYWCMKSKVAQDDSVGSQGLAVDAYIKLAEVCRTLDSTARAAGSADSIKYRKYIIDSYSQLAGYYNNIKKDKETALVYLHKILEVDPANADAPRFIEILSRPARQPRSAPAGGTRRAAAK
jgi:tetratricopeptide (TPR) repeat protein